LSRKIIHFIDGDYLEMS